MERVSTFLRSGSPPHVREGLRVERERQLMGGDHPRMCGKDDEDISDVFQVRGSPPLAREGLSASTDKELNIGITPARAGRTKRVYRLYIITQDHPRSRGKDLPPIMISPVAKGSPPLTREGRRRY